MSNGGCLKPHPAPVRTGRIDSINADYHELVYTVERHTRFSPVYCLRQKHFDAPAECRFGFPKDLQEKTKIFYTYNIVLITNRY